MSESHYFQFIPAACAGIGLFIVGVASLLLSRRSFVVRSLATFGVVGVVLAGVESLDVAGATARTAKVLALGLIPFALLASGRLIACASATISSLRLPSVRYGLLALSGIAIVVGAGVSYHRADEAALDEIMADLDVLGGRSALVPSERERATTDRGTQIALLVPRNRREDVDWNRAEERTLQGNKLTGQVIQRGGGTDEANCHGWVFTGGKYNLTGANVESILAENGYRPVTEPEPGDIVIYRSTSDNVIQHTAIVRYVTQGQPVMVEGKWGALGVFLHPADKCTYGTDYTFHRSERHGHLLAGLGGSPQPSLPAQTQDAETE